MSDRIHRLRSLAQEIELLGLQLAERSSTAAAALFIDRYHRCACFTPAEHQAADVAELIGIAEQAWAASTLEVGSLAGRGIDLENLLERAYALQAGAADEGAQDWAVELLLLAGVAPWVPGERGERMAEVLWRCLELARAFPERFHPAAVEVLDRLEFEGVDGLHEDTREALEALRELPLLLALDRAETQSTAAQLRERLDSFVADVTEGERQGSEDSLVVRRRQMEPRAAARPAWFRGVHRAEDAWSDAVGYQRQRAEFIARASEGIRAAAATEDEFELRLGRRAGHDFRLVVSGTQLFLAVVGEAWSKIEARIAEEEHALSAQADEDGGRWLLPAASAWPPEGLSIELRLGADGWRFEIQQPWELA